MVNGSQVVRSRRALSGPGHFALPSRSPYVQLDPCDRVTVGDPEPVVKRAGDSDVRRLLASCMGWPIGPEFDLAFVMFLRHSFQQSVRPRSGNGSLNFTACVISPFVPDHTHLACI